MVLRFPYSPKKVINCSHFFTIPFLGGFLPLHQIIFALEI